MFKRATNSSRRLRNFSTRRGYLSAKANLGDYPRRAFTPGLEGGLTIDALYTNSSHLNDLCDGSLQGFKVAIHPTGEFPNMEKHIKVPLNHVVNIAVKPSVVLVSQQLRNYGPEQRKCYFLDEKYLATYKLYTRQNCLDECLANLTLARCGCIPFYFAPSGGPAKFCGAGSFECVQHSKLKYLEKEDDRCACLPSCYMLSYDLETSQIDWNWKRFFNVADNLGDTFFSTKALKSAHLSTLNVYYKDLSLRTCERNELIGLVDFVSDVGGLLGLFIGFSVTSAIEILYFLTLRIVCNVRKYGQRAWSGHSQAANPTK